MAHVILLQSRTSLLIWQGRKKPQWHLGHSHSYQANTTLCFCHSTYTPHIFTMSDDMDQFPLGVNYYYYKGDSVFQKEEEKWKFLKITRDTWLQTEDSLREWLLITTLKLLTIWFNNQKLEAVLCFGHSCSFFIVCVSVPCTGRKKPHVTTLAGHMLYVEGITLRERADSHLSSLQCSQSLPPQACRNTAATIKTLIHSQHCRKSTRLHVPGSSVFCFYSPQHWPLHTKT